MVEKKRAMQRRRISSTMHAEKQRGPAEKERERGTRERGGWIPVRPNQNPCPYTLHYIRIRFPRTLHLTSYILL